MMRSVGSSLRIPAAWIGVPLALGAIACATSPERGFLVATWTTPAGVAQKITVAFHREVRGHGSLSMQLGPSGERFSGEYVRIDDGVDESRLRRIHEAWVSDHFESTSGNLPGRLTEGSAMTLEGLRRHYDRQLLATLRGDLGHLMRCHLELVDADRGLPGGAFGACSSSAGDRIVIEDRRGRARAAATDRV